MPRIKLLPLAAIICLSVTIIFADSLQKPQWVTEQPVNSLYYIGIGSVIKKNHPTDFRQIAKNEALRDISSEISVSISGQMLSSITDSAGKTREYVNSYITSRTQARLEGYEQVAIWENSVEYWVYYRLSKAGYLHGREALKRKAVNLSTTLYDKARQSIVSNNIGAAFNFHIQAILAIEDYIAEPIEISLDNKQTCLQNELVSSLQSMLTALEFQSPDSGFSVKIGQASKFHFAVNVRHITPHGKKLAVDKFPINFIFVKGNGHIRNPAITDTTGTAYCQIVNVTSPEKTQIIEAQPDFTAITRDTSALLSQSLIKKLSLPQVSCILDVSGPSVYIKSEESLSNNKLVDKLIEPQLKQGLAVYGYCFTDDSSKADLSIELKAEARNGSQIMNSKLFSAFCDVGISITDMTSHREIYKDGVDGIKEISSSFEKAGIKALQSAGKSIIKKLPAIIDKIQN
jgi:hypothetical protein